MKNIAYTSTRGNAQVVPFTKAIIDGQASDGGLYIPQEIPKITTQDLTNWENLSYQQLVVEVFKRFKTDIPTTVWKKIVDTAYANFDTKEICPIHSVDDKTHILELWHGPTAAFKDMALQIFPKVFSYASQCQTPDKKYLVLTATSGDTGSAAMAGFANTVIKICVFYPSKGISSVQESQMLILNKGNAHAIPVRGNFDDAQRGVKEIFSDKDFNSHLQEKYNTVLTSANSINWGRLLPQIVYYVWAATKLKEDFDVVVPSGNFGNILAAYYAKAMGVPVGKLICASNKNHVLTDFIRSGIYDIHDRKFYKTSSPSMDILISNNVERLLWELTHNPWLVKKWQKELKRDNFFRVSDCTFKKLKNNFVAHWAKEDETIRAMKTVWEKYDYPLDPHTAVGWCALERQRGLRPMLLVSTAHWAKFPAYAEKAFGKLPKEKPKALKGIQPKSSPPSIAVSTASIRSCITSLL